MTELVKYDAACRAIAEARSVDELKPIRNSAAALRAYARQAKNRDLEIDAMEIRVRAERRVGELMAKQADSGGLKRGGDRKSKVAIGPLKPITLDEVGIDKHLAHRARELVRLDEQTFEHELRDWRERTRSGRDPVTAALLRSAVDTAKPVQAIAPPFPEGTFRTFVIDPPWPMAKSARIETPEQGQRLDYPTMSVDAIRTVIGDKLKAHAAADTQVYLWVTHRFLPAGLALLQAWGLTYHCVLTWMKPSGFTPFSWMFNTEHALFAYRGTFKLERLGLKVGFSAPTGRHSEKPDAFYELVEQVGAERRVDVFARRERPGWTAWGNEV